MAPTDFKKVINILHRLLHNKSTLRLKQSGGEIKKKKKKRTEILTGKKKEEKKASPIMAIRRRWKQQQAAPVMKRDVVVSEQHSACLNRWRSASVVLKGQLLRPLTPAGRHRPPTRHLDITAARCRMTDRRHHMQARTHRSEWFHAGFSRACFVTSSPHG